MKNFNFLKIFAEFPQLIHLILPAFIIRSGCVVKFMNVPSTSH